MKRVWRTFTFWICGLSLTVIILHLAGGDTHGIILIGLNPLLRLVSHSELLCSMMNTGPIIQASGVIGPMPGLPIYWYIGSMVTSFVYGVLLDLLRTSRKKRRTTPV